MYTLKIATTVLAGFLMLIFAISLEEAAQKKNKANIIGLSLIELVYILSLICMWA